MSFGPLGISFHLAKKMEFKWCEAIAWNAEWESGTGAIHADLCVRWDGSSPSPSAMRDILGFFSWHYLHHIVGKPGNGSCLQGGDSLRLTFSVKRQVGEWAWETQTMSQYFYTRKPMLLLSSFLHTLRECSTRLMRKALLNQPGDAHWG